MKQRLFIVGFLVLLVAILVGLNAASYVQKPKTQDSEFSPNRSTFNPGTTGTQAFFTLLNESGRKAVRWQDSPGALLTAKGDFRPAVFVVTGTLRRSFTEPEKADLLRWVSDGGRLIIIDRDPPDGLLVTTAHWKVNIKSSDTVQLFGVDAADQRQMTKSVAAVKPVQPTTLTQSVNAVQPSVFASSAAFERYSETKEQASTRDQSDVPPPTGRSSGTSVEAPSDEAPVAHFASANANLLIDVPFGAGRIVFLADPYIVSNGGIALADNAQLAINLTAGGTAAFDEYHQGYGHDSNRFVQFFEGTPVIAIFLQGVILIGLVFFSQSRRFARPVPEPEPDRLSKLEYVAAMAELQSRTRAFDLAVENIYNDFRRRVCRLLGLDNSAVKSGEIAKLVAERTGLDAAVTANDLFMCEEIIRGEPTNRKEVMRLVESIRSIEERLQMKRSPGTRA